MSRRDSNPLYKLIVLGDGGVGKTALTIQLCLNHFVETYDPTIEDSYRKQVVIDNQPAILEVLDTAGQEEYTALRDQWIRDGEGFILVYSITSRSSFSRIKNYFSQIQRVKEDDEAYSLVLVGNKSDRSGERQVSTAEGQALARELGNVPFFESSAKLNINTENAFFACARKCRLIRDPVAYHQYLQQQQQQQQQQQNQQLQQGAQQGLQGDKRQGVTPGQQHFQSQLQQYPMNAGNNEQDGKKKKKKSKCLVM
uniref:ARAD1B21186p n=1 Tax=Blastobotrys adeninivorans TaxID=409370 RepID=A0A060TC77_BLAAD